MLACGIRLGTYDYYGLPKASYYSFKRSAKPVMLSVDLEDEKYKFHICNDGKEKNLFLKWYAVSENGDIVYKSESKEVFAEANISFVAHEIEETDVSNDCFIVADIDGDRAFYRKGNLEIAPCNTIDIIEINGDYIVLKANKYTHIVELNADAVFEDNYFSMLPNEEKTITFKKMGDMPIKVNTYTIGR